MKHNYFKHFSVYTGFMVTFMLSSAAYAMNTTVVGTLVDAASSSQDLCRSQVLSNTRIPTQSEVYAAQEQFDHGAANAYYLSIQKESCFQIKKADSNQLADKNAPVYGYNDNQTLDVNGGTQKSWLPQFNKFCLRYSSPVPEDQLEIMTQSNLVSATKHAARYNYQRGLQLQFQDIPTGYETMFGYLNRSYILDPIIMTVQLVRNNDKEPFAVDLMASLAWGDFFAPLNVGLFEQDASKRQNGFWYPIRIPLTTDCNEYATKSTVEPMAYYDRSSSQVVINVPQNNSGYLMGSQVDIYPDVPDSFDNFELQEYLQAFHGTFALLDRSEKTGDLKPSKDTPTADVLVQSSDTVHIDTNIVIFGFPIPYSFDIARESDDTYTGALLPLMGQGHQSYDIWVTPNEFMNSLILPPGFTSAGYLSPTVPNGGQTTGFNNNQFSQGDNPATKLKELFTTLFNLRAIDNDLWYRVIRGLPRDILAGETFPENRSAYPSLEEVSGEVILGRLMAHEFNHGDPQSASFFTPYEAIATAVELDPRANLNTFHVKRVKDFALQHLRYTRGQRTIMDTLYFEPSDGGSSNTYGQAPFWRYLATQFDANYQIPRRVRDILNTETAGPLWLTQQSGFIWATPTNYSGGTLALEQALQELYGLDIRDVWTDFSISHLFLRNNLAIPEKYRQKFPFWIWSEQYSDYATLVDLMQEVPPNLNPLASIETDEHPFSTHAFNLLTQAPNKLDRPECSFGNIAPEASQFANYWDLLQDNAEIPASWDTILYPDTIITPLPEEFSSDAYDMTFFAFAIQPETNTIKVEMPQGEWRLSIVQFTSDGTPVGIWNQDGPHAFTAPAEFEFDVSGHIPAYNPNRPLYLIAVHTSITDLGGFQNYLGEPVFSGHIDIKTE